ncbi:MAG: hypothetical protein QM710_00335 [Flavobacterium sp.]
MKRKLHSPLLVLFLFTLLAPSVNFAQITVTIGTGSSSGTSSPIASFYNSSASESIYTATEIGSVGNITKIAYIKASGSSTENPNVKIYMKMTSLETIGTAAYTIGSQNLSNYTLVFDGQLPNNSTSGTMEVVLATPFRYSSLSQNLSVLVVGTTCISSGRPQYKYTTTSSKMTAGYTDGSIGCGGTTNFSENASFSPVWERPNTILTLAALSNDTFEINNAITVTVNNNQLQISSEKAALKNVALFDLTGRQLHFSEVNSNVATIHLNGTKQVIIAKITTEDNAIITKKILL